MSLRLCANLRWKGFYGQMWRDEAEMNEVMMVTAAPYTCLHTCQPWGPDDQQVVPGGCQPGRSCFAPSEHEPGAPERLG